MNDTAKLKIIQREKSSKSAIKQLRRDGYLPGSISQKGEDAISFSIKKDELRKAILQNGISGIYSLQSGRKKPWPAMVREIQYAPVTREWQHITFQLVSLTEETTADIPLNIIGREDVQHAGFELLTQMETVTLRGLPTDFPSAIDVIVSEMTPGDQVTVADLKLPEGLSAEGDTDRLILSVSHPRVQVEEVAEEAAAEETAEATEEAAPEAE